MSIPTRNHTSSKSTRIRVRSIVCPLLILLSTMPLVSAPGGGKPGGSGGGNVDLYGFNTHIYTIPRLYSPLPNLTSGRFDQNIDELTGKVRWVRFALWEWETFPRTDTTTGNIDCGSNPVNCNPSGLQAFEQAIDYARFKGFKVHLVTNVPSWAKVYSQPAQPWETSYTVPEYRAITQDYYSILAARFTGKVQAWSVFNEANVHNFDRWDQVPTLDAAYLGLLADILGVARSAIKSHDAQGLITTSVGGWPYSQALHDQWKQYFDALYTHLDLISLDIYPDDDQAIIDALESRVNEMKDRYAPVLVGVAETGMCTDSVRFTEADQGTYVPTYVSKLKRASPYFITLYEYQDDNQGAAPCENAFGVVRANGTRKSSYDKVMRSLK